MLPMSEFTNQKLGHGCRLFIDKIICKSCLNAAKTVYIYGKLRYYYLRKDKKQHDERNQKRELR